MDPLWAMLADLWWLAPATVGAGAVGWGAVSMARGSGRARHLEVEASLHDVRVAAGNLSRARAAVLAARAGVARADADRLARRATSADVAAARHALQQAERDVRAAGADLRARRANVRAARAAVPPRRAGIEALPLSRLIARHDALLSRWLAYETDAAKAIDYPSMSDPHDPLTAEFLRAQSTAQWLRPSGPDVKMQAADYAAYRDAVYRAEYAFAVAERAAQRGRGEVPDAPASGDHWSDLARDVMDTTSRAIARSAEAVARAAEAGWKNRRRPPEG
ncbi:MULTISPECIES: hypothetical protein [Microbacterium]|uniref:Secreted protein n=1 Tax=Microbacterium wangchenii TaxID=2541726 RepID=A0ABX5SME7_9MICO|nr:MULTISPECIES: hypothetical protein [Microbacterium]MCK6066310.1 hypothetical protein [Microbacterium sp. EYE_512]QBR87284.1 hypothetical protein E4K62_00360 [Microbacterium wangchenii]